MGGVIRYVLEQNNAADSAKEAGKGKAKVSLIEICRTMHSQNLSANDGVLIYRFLHMYSSDHTSVNATVVIASEYARRICLEGLDIGPRNKVIALLKYNTVSDMQGYYEFIFEVHAYKAFAEDGLLNIRRLSSANYNDTFSKSLLQSYSLPKSYDLFFTGSISKAPTRFKDIFTLEIVKHMYYQPNNMNFASIDSFVIVDNDVLAFQVTFDCKKNGIKASGLRELYETVNKTFPNLHYHIIFLCPTGDKSSKNFEAVKISSTGNNIYKNVANISKNAQRFEWTQWISEIEMNLLKDK